ncbi:MAG TPA: tetratricopeptide repeat protein [Caulobacteraceae bacterium]|nr:tetratricopeptide repeat protein [Caulobacteraceae bacterium]
MSLLYPSQRLSAVWTLAVCAVLAGGALTRPALAQAPGYQQAVPPTNPNELSGDRMFDRRLDRDEQVLRDLRQIVLQAKATGAPVTVTSAGPDPAIAEMQGKIDDFAQTLQRLNGQIESLEHNLELARKGLADSADANRELSARLAKLEGAQAATPTPAAPTSAQPGVLGQLPAGAVGAPDQSAAPGGADEILTYRQARQVLDTGDYAGGAAALQDYLARYPNSPRAAEANYWLGRTLAVRNMHPDAAAAYARALKGWPQSAWAGDAVVRLSASLIELKRADDACRAMSEYDQRYAGQAPQTLKARAKDVRTRAACG